MLKKPLYLLFIILLYILVSCNPVPNNSATPEILKFGVSTRDEDPEEAMYRMEGIKKYLEKELGIKVKIYQTTGYAAAIEALKSDKLDLMSMGSYSYILAADRAKVEAIVCRGTLNGNIEPYYSLIITRRGSHIKNMKDVIRKASALTMSYGDPASTSGHLYPRDYLESIGLNNELFKQVCFTNSHSATILTVRAGKTDIGCVSEGTLNKLTREGKVSRDEFVVLWKSEPIINGAVCIRKKFTPAFKTKVQKALMDFRFKDPENWNKYATLIGKETILSLNSICFIHACDSMYDHLRVIAERYNMYKKVP